MNIYLDDIRPTPAGYFRTYTVEETIDLIKKNNGEVEYLSLDNDLGLDLLEGRKVMDWLEEQAFYNTIQPIPNIIIHSGNSVAVDVMKQAMANCWKFWNSNGYNRREWLEKGYKYI